MVTSRVTVKNSSYSLHGESEQGQSHIDSIVETRHGSPRVKSPPVFEDEPSIDLKDEETLEGIAS